jgi:hypothetical protein
MRQTLGVFGLSMKNGNGHGTPKPLTQKLKYWLQEKRTA